MLCNAADVMEVERTIVKRFTVYRFQGCDTNVDTITQVQT